MNDFSFPVRLARRFPDPNFSDTHGIERHVLFVPASAVPSGLSYEPNARLPQLNKRVYRDLKQSLLNKDCEPGTFHLKHKGITLVATSVKKKRDDLYIVSMAPGQGILDGGHTYALLTKDCDEEIPDDQFVKVEVLTGVPDDWIVELSQGLNTSVQVQDMSLDNLARKFDWIKKIVQNESYANDIAWKEGEKGAFDARDIVSILTCFNIDLFPNTKDEQPVVAYEKKSSALRLFDDPENEGSYRKLAPLLKDILKLHDIIRKDSGKHWNEAGGRFGSLAFVESVENTSGKKQNGADTAGGRKRKRKPREYDFPFTGERGKHRLRNGALYPMLAAFRWMVEEKNGKYAWRGGFQNVMERWENSAAELMKATAAANQELGRNPNAIGKSRNHWANLHARVAMRDLMQRTQVD